MLAGWISVGDEREDIAAVLRQVRDEARAGAPPDLERAGEPPPGLPSAHRPPRATPETSAPEPLDPPDGALVVYCKTHEPVIWNVWIGFEPEDVGELLAFVLRPSTLAFMVKAVFKLTLTKLGFKKKEVKPADSAKAVEA